MILGFDCALIANLLATFRSIRWDILITIAITIATAIAIDMAMAIAIATRAHAQKFRLRDDHLEVTMLTISMGILAIGKRSVLSKK